jgi:hypothetical protein
MSEVVTPPSNTPAAATPSSNSAPTGSPAAGAVAATPPSGSLPNTTPNGGTNYPKNIAPDADPKAPAAAAGTDAEAKAAEAVKKARKYQAKVFGEVEEVDLDAMSDEEILKHYQMSRAGSRAMQEKAQVFKQFDEFKKLIATDPFEAAKLFNVDLEKAAEERLARRYQEMTMPEPERKLLEAQREIEAYKQREAQREAQYKAEQARVHEERLIQETTEKFTAALKKAGLPESPQLMGVMANIAQINLDHGIELTVEQLASEVNKQVEGYGKLRVDAMDDEAFEKWIGEDRLKRLIKRSVERVRAKKAPAFKAPPAAQQATEEPSEKQRRQAQSLRDFRKFVED